ncbi:hypothetical protein ACJX0J_040023, partial [Zea mays]
SFISFGVGDLIGGLEETIRKLTRTFENFADPSFPSYETSNKIYVVNLIVIGYVVRPKKGNYIEKNELKKNNSVITFEIFWEPILYDS